MRTKKAARGDVQEAGVAGALEPGADPVFKASRHSLRSFLLLACKVLIHVPKMPLFSHRSLQRCCIDACRILPKGVEASPCSAM